MLKNQLITIYSKLNLIKRSDMISLNAKCLQTSTVIQNKFERRNRDTNYIERNDNLLNLNKIFNEKPKKRFDNENRSTNRPTKKKYLSKKKFESKNMIQADLEKTEPHIEELFM